MRREVISSRRFDNELKALLGGDDHLVEEFLSGLEFILQGEPEAIGVETPNEGIWLTFGKVPRRDDLLIDIFYRFDPMTAPATSRAVYLISARLIEEPGEPSK